MGGHLCILQCFGTEKCRLRCFGVARCLFLHPGFERSRFRSARAGKRWIQCARAAKFGFAGYSCKSQTYYEIKANHESIRNAARSTTKSRPTTKRWRQQEERIRNTAPFPKMARGSFAEEIDLSLECLREPGLDIKDRAISRQKLTAMQYSLMPAPPQESEHTANERWPRSFWK